MAAAVCAAALLSSGCAYFQKVNSPNSTVGGAVDHPAMSADGRYTAYTGITDTTAPNLVFGIYRYDTLTNTRVRATFAYPGWVPEDDVFDTTYPDDTSWEPAISADGRYIAFASDTTNLVPNDTNDSTDVFVRDMVANTTTRVSVHTDGSEGDDDSYTPSISANGRRVVFLSDSDVFSAADNNGWTDGYVRDLQTNTTVLATRGNVALEDGASEAVISGDGNFVAFTTDTDLGTGDDNWSDDVYVRNLAAGTTTRISKPKSGIADEGGGDSPSLSFDGRYVAFIGWADIDGAPDPFGGRDVFVRDTVTKTTARVSLGPTGGYLDGSASDPTLSADGRRVIYRSTGDATGTDANGSVVDVYVRDLNLSRNYLVSTDALGTQGAVDTTAPRISADGRYAGFLNRTGATYGDGNGVQAVYLRAIDIPLPTSIAPTTAARGSTFTLTVNGSSFLNGVTLVPLTPDYTVGTPTFVNEKKFTIPVTISPTAATGPFTFYVKNPGSGAGPNGGAVGECKNCLTIT